MHPEARERFTNAVHTLNVPGQGRVIAWDRGADPAQVDREVGYAQQIIRNTDEGGSSSDLWSLKPYEQGEEAYMVGGTPKFSERKLRHKATPIPTQLVDVGNPSPKLSVADVFGTRENMFADTRGYNNAVYGTWNEPGLNRIDVDASTMFADKTKGEDFTLSRKEYAMYDNGKGESVSNEDIRRARGLPVSPKDTEKEAKQEVVYRRHGER